MKVLLAVDDSAATQHLVNQICARPWPEPTEMCALTVIDSYAVAHSLTGFDAVTKFQVEAAEAFLHNVCRRLTGLGTKVTNAVVEGYPPLQILDYAEQWMPDLILLGSHGHGAVARFLLGSTSKTVIRQAQCSVEIIRPSEGGKAGVSTMPFRVLVATDGSESSAHALESVASLPWPAQTDVTVMSVLETTIPLADPGYLPANLMDAVFEENKRLAQQALDDAKTLFDARHITASFKLVEGTPKTAILETAKSLHTDLIVVGSHGRRGLQRVLLGSVSETVALHAGCSVLIVR